MTIRSPRRARVADDDERDAGMTERLDVLGVALLAVFLVVFFFGADFFAVAFFIGVFLALAVAFFFAGMTPPRTGRLRSDYAPHPLDGERQELPRREWCSPSDAPAASGHARAVQQRPA